MKERRRVAIQNAEKRWQEDNNQPPPSHVTGHVTGHVTNGDGIGMGFDTLSHYSEVNI